MIDVRRRPLSWHPGGRPRTGQSNCPTEALADNASRRYHNDRVGKYLWPGRHLPWPGAPTREAGASRSLTVAVTAKRANAGSDFVPVFFMIEARWFSSVRWLMQRPPARSPSGYLVGARRVTFRHSLFALLRVPARQVSRLPHAPIGAQGVSRRDPTGAREPAADYGTVSIFRICSSNLPSGTIATHEFLIERWTSCADHLVQRPWRYAWPAARI